MTKVGYMLKDTKLPRMIKIKQDFPHPIIGDVSSEIRNVFSRGGIAGVIHKGMSIGIAAGSRGIANIAAIMREIVSICEERGAAPFIFPAMGSHGGATAQGQIDILKSLGITEANCGCPIRATMETRHLGYTEAGDAVQIDKYAAEADGFIIVNRIKPHTAFRGPYESGLMKMLAIGCGKQRGADSCHVNGFKYMHRLVPSIGTAIMKNSNLLFGLGIIENAYDETAALYALTPDEIISEEPELLIKARELMGKLLFDETDLLVVDRIGKNISGEGADPNITGQQVTPYASGGIKYQRLIALSLTEETHGNAAGFGTFDAISKRLYDQIDFDATYTNAITNTLLHTVKTPIILENDHDTIAAALKSCHEIDHEAPRVIRIKDTSHIDNIYISEALLAQAEKNPDIHIMSNPEPFIFNANGNLW